MSEQELAMIQAEIWVLEKALELAKSNRIPKKTWETWDVWAGRNVMNEESNERWLRRILEVAINECKKEHA